MLKVACAGFAVASSDIYAWVVFIWLQLPWTSRQPAINHTQLAGEIGYGFSCFVCYVELKIPPTNAICLFSVYMKD